jgi:hypothetical protein
MALKPLNSVAGFSVGETPANIILANGDITTNNITTTGKANLNAIGNVIITGGTNGQVIQTDGNGNLTFTTISTASLANGNSNIQVLANGNITFSSAGTANVAVITSTGMNVAGYISGGNITANGNVSVNNYIVTPSTVDLIVAPDTQLTRFNSNVNPFSGGYSLGNSIARWDNVFANTANIDGNVSAGNVLTNNLLYANGQPWDLQEAAGANKEIQYNDGSNNFGASANFTFDYGTNLLTVNGNAQFNNANLGNLATANFVNVSSNTTTNNLTVNLQLDGNTANFTGNIIALNANLGNLVTANYANFANDLAVQGNVVGANVVIANSFTSNGGTIDFATNNPNVNLGAVGNVHITGGSASQYLQTDGLGNLTWTTADTSGIANGTSNVSIPDLNGNVNTSVNGNANVFVVTGTGANVNGNLDASGNLTVQNANLGNLATANYANIITDLVVQGNIANAGNISVTYTIQSNTVDVSANTTTSNLTVNLELSGNTANFSGNVIAPNLTVNLELSGNTANFTGNVVAANFIGSLSNGSSNVKVYSNANIEFTINGTANVATISSTGLYVAGEINTTTGNMLSNGNITANLFLNSANANVTGEADLGSVKTANITAPTGIITISAAAGNNNIVLSPTGSGTVDTGLHRVTQLGAPVDPNDAATKEYVDNISQGLYIHPAANVTSVSNLNASYLNGGTVLSATTITGGKTITFSTNHGLSVDSDIEFTNTFNGIIASEQYFVFSVPAANQITIKDGYFGAEVTTLTNAAGLTQPALAEGGVGATLTNAGAQAALTIDGILMTVGARVLVQGQTNQTENGIYSVTTVGTGATNWVLTRSTDGNSYAPKSDSQLGAGSYFFVMQGSQYAGSSYVLTAPPGEINFGTSNIVFSQFSQAGAYTAGNGISIIGTLISANVDLVTTDIVSGNIVVKTGANLTTPNLGDATFSSLSWNTLSNGNVTANNLSIGNIANITGNLRVDGIIASNGNVTSNAFINGNNASFTNFANIGGNLLANNITSNNAFSTNTANISSNLVTSNATVNLALSGNTANFSGNVIVNNLTVNLALDGNTANFTGNITTLNANLGNLVTANYGNFANDLVVQGNIANANNISVTNLINGNTANFSGNIIAPTFSANTSVLVGNTTITHGNVTTTTTSANQTIASFSVTGVTGVEYIVKGIDAGGKYSVATVLAVTDGTNADYTVYGTTQLGGYTGSLAVNISGSFIRLQVTPASSNSTVWVTQYRLI